MRRLIPTEAEEQATLVEWLRLRKILFCHVPNVSDVPVQYRVKLAKMGLVAGVPDLLIFDPPPRGLLKYHGTALELKRRKGGRLSENQDRWGWELQGRGWCWVLARGAGEAIAALEELGY